MFSPSMPSAGPMVLPKVSSASVPNLVIFGGSCVASLGSATEEYASFMIMTLQNDVG